MLSIEKSPSLPTTVTIDPTKATVEKIKTALLGLDIEAHEDFPGQGVILKMGDIEANVKRTDIINIVLGLQLAQEEAANQEAKAADEKPAPPVSSNKSAKTP